jgi:hypothetical protein
MDCLYVNLKELKVEMMSLYIILIAVTAKLTSI